MKTIKTISGVILTSLLCVGVLYAATTIGENITTAGNLEVTGNATTTGVHYFGSDLFASSVLVGTRSAGSFVNGYGLYASTTGSSAGTQTSITGYYSGLATYGSGIGIFGYSVAEGSSANVVGVKGQASSASLPTIGVLGVSTSPSGLDGIGVSGNVGGEGTNYALHGSSISSLGATAYGLYAVASGDGTNYAGYFDSYATTTVAITNQSETQGSCLMMKNSAGATKYVTIEGDILTVSDDSCLD